MSALIIQSIYAANNETAVLPSGVLSGSLSRIAGLLLLTPGQIPPKIVATGLNINQLRPERVTHRDKVLC
jgi:hypothetical protein